ncbi:MAG: hypothetical protein H0V62_01555 [Gammaproteobacteria bacterium]|nr:hypothetical protein [Gammaproteobacteria bacterium]MBA3731962.1 hypothetical protein [Gammaproteobacteria bacterium]
MVIRVSPIAGWHRRSRGRRVILTLTIALLGATTWTSSQAITPGLYDIGTETLMPHLEDNLRYANSRERQCLRGDLPAAFFPTLRHRSFDGCELGACNGRDPVYYPLVCRSSQAPTGAARLSETGEHVSGVLEIQMGGKNMTFSQRIEATRLGDCRAER